MIFILKSQILYIIISQIQLAGSDDRYRLGQTAKDQIISIIMCFQDGIKLSFPNNKKLQLTIIVRHRLCSAVVN